MKKKKYLQLENVKVFTFHRRRNVAKINRKNTEQQTTAIKFSRLENLGAEATLVSTDFFI